MRRGIGAVRRAGTSGDGQAPHSPSLSHDVGFPIARRQQQRAPPAAPSRHRSAPAAAAAAATATGAAAAQARPDGLAEEERVLAVRCHPALTPDRM